RFSISHGTCALNDAVVTSGQIRVSPDVTGVLVAYRREGHHAADLILMTLQTQPTAEIASSSAPARPGVVLLALILVAGVANLNLAVANVALPSIGAAFDASQTSLNQIAVGYSLGLAASVLYFGAVGD